MVDPELVRQRAKVARGREAEGGGVGGDHHVAHQGEVAAAGEAIAVDLGDDRLVHVEDRHAPALLALQLPGVVVDGPMTAIGRRRLVLDRRDRNFTVSAREVIPRAEGAACAFENYAVYGRVIVGFPERCGKLGLHDIGERVELRRAVQRNAGMAVLHGVEDGVKTGHGERS